MNCATLRGDGAMSALFGHVKGAFTGARRTARRACLRAADGGVLFLDEIGELGLDEQAMLLRAIEEKRSCRSAPTARSRATSSCIAGTNRDLARPCAAGTFREDLLARINLWTFRLPGLRERPEDIEPNLDYELERWTRDARRRASRSTARRASASSRSPPRPSAAGPATSATSTRAVMRMATLAAGGRITAQVVDEEIARLRALVAAPRQRRWRRRLARYLGRARIAALDRFDRVQLADVLRVCRTSSSLSDAGRTLFAAPATPHDHQRRRPPAQVPRALRAHLGRARGRTWSNQVSSAGENCR